MTSIQIDMQYCCLIGQGFCFDNLVTFLFFNLVSESLPTCDAVEGKRTVSPGWSLVRWHFAPAYATAVTFSFVYHCGFGFKASLMPTVQVAPEGFQIFLYDCKTDAMLVQNFLWSRTSLICLWAFLHYHIFFPHTLTPDVCGFVPKLGYGYPYQHKTGFRALRKAEFYFGLSKNSKEWKQVEPKTLRALIV